MKRYVFRKSLAQGMTVWYRLMPVLGILCAFLAGGGVASASQAYGTINNFDAVNDTGRECHGFEIEIDGVHSTDITYTYDWNHYGKPKISEDAVGVRVRYESAKNPDGTWAAFTAIPAVPIAPTQGHQFTNPSVNFGGEHFGVGYRGAPSAIKYNWLSDDGAGNLIYGGAVQVATPIFAYSPPVPPAPGVPAVPAQVQAVIAPPPPPAPEPLEFGKASWVKEIRTTTHNSEEVNLRDLVDPGAVGRKDWRNGEPDEVEVEWQILQTDYNAGPGGGANGELAGAPEDLPNNDEIITRRYEFYEYTGPIDTETGEAMAQTVAADGKHGVGVVTVNGVDYDLSTIEIVGKFFGAQMSAFDLGKHASLIDHLDDGEINVPYPDRMVVITGNAAATVTSSGALPAGLIFDQATGLLSGTPTEFGVFSFTVNAEDANTPKITKTYTLTIVDAGAVLPPQSTIDTSVLPPDSGTTTGDGPYDNGTNILVNATAKPGFVFDKWTDNSVAVSNSATYSFTTDVNRSLVANFVAAPPLSLSVNDVATTEGNAGTKMLTFTVKLSQVSATDVTVDFATTDGATFPATAGSDYTTSGGTLTFAPGITTRPISVPLLGDTLDEEHETILVMLSNAVGAPIVKAQGVGTILDDDALSSSLAISDVVLTEGDAGTTDANFTVTMSKASGRVVTVKYATANPGSIPATPDTDYVAVPSTTLTFPPGITALPITVQVNGDMLDEFNERFSVVLSGAINATIADKEGFCTINNDDATPSVSINDVTVTEGNSGTVAASFAVTLSAPSGKTVTVQYSTATPGSLAATAGSDYTAVPTTKLTFAPGETSKLVTVSVNGDTLDEITEHFAVNLKNAVNATLLRKEAFCTIMDDDATPSLGINDVSQAEGDSGTTAFTFTVTLSAASGKAVTVKYATSTPSTTPATAGSDYTAVPLTTLVFAPGQTSKTVTVLVTGDTSVEGVEHFSVRLSNAVNATIGDSEGFGTITNDDLAALQVEDDAPSE